MKYTDLLFDMDGTLNESGAGIKNGFRITMEKLGRPLAADAELDFVIGPPLAWSFEQLGVKGELNAEAVRIYREYYTTEGLFVNKPYEGITEMLQELRLAGINAHIATSKPELVTLRILEHFNMRQYFGVVAGASADDKRSEKADVIAYALSQLPVGKESVLMVGDRHHDIDGAKMNGLKSAGVLWGYGTLKELEEAGADYVLKTPGEVVDLVRGQD